jgi:hypothetical protein
MTISAPSASNLSQIAIQRAVSVSSKIGGMRTWKAVSPAITSFFSGNHTMVSP